MRVKAKACTVESWWVQLELQLWNLNVENWRVQFKVESWRLQLKVENSTGKREMIIVKLSSTFELDTIALPD